MTCHLRMMTSANDIQKAIERELDAMKNADHAPKDDLAELMTPIGTPETTIGAVLVSGDGPEMFDESAVRKKMKAQKKAELLARQQRLQELEKQLESVQQQLVANSK